jgi:hypothetical protein
MSRALSESLGWLRRKALSYLVIVAVLLAGTWLLNQYRHAAATGAEYDRIDAAVRQQRLHVGQAQDRVARTDQVLATQLAVLRKARDVAQQQLLLKEQEREAHRLQHWPWAGLHGPDALLESRLLDEQVTALRGAARFAQEKLDAAQAVQNSASALQQLQAQARGKRAEADRLRAEWRRISAAHPVAQRLPWAPQGAQLDRLKLEVERLQQEAVAVERAIATAARSREVIDSLGARSALAAAQAQLRLSEARHAALQAALERNPYRRLRDALREFVEDKRRILLLALVLLLAAIVSRLLVKLFLYFVVAPAASRRRAVQLCDAVAPIAFAQALSRGPQGRISAESITLRLGPDEELLVRPEYLQSTSEAAGKRTAWLLDASLPFTSLLSGMYLLTRVRAQPGDPIVLSPAQDPLEEVAWIDLPPGAALVCQPRCLAGVVQRRGARLRVTRHWRIGSLHAWLTFQLRFLVFHGPCQLVLKGRRGVRMEAAGAGRLVGPAATLAFDASVPYSSARTETFVPYWLGKQELFKDRFGGIDGSYLYEERPLDRRGNVLLGRGLEGLADGVLKAFGI